MFVLNEKQEKTPSSGKKFFFHGPIMRQGRFCSGCSKISKSIGTEIGEAYVWLLKKLAVFLVQNCKLLIRALLLLKKI